MRIAIGLVALGAWLLGWTWSSVVLGLGSDTWRSNLFGVLSAGVAVTAVVRLSSARQEAGARLFGRFVISALLGALPSGLLICGVSYVVAAIIHDQEVGLIALSVGALGAVCAMPMVGGLSLLQLKVRRAPPMTRSAAGEGKDGDRASEDCATDDDKEK